MEAKTIGKILKWARARSPWVTHFNTGGCNGCDIELIAVFTPRYDVERFGVMLKGSPRHADILAVTGPVTRQVRDRLLRIYEQIPEPKYVVAIGTCAVSGAPFWDGYNVLGGVDKILPVDVYIPGCPPRPEAILYGLKKLIEKMEAGENAE